MMKMKIHGAAGEVTGSCIELEHREIEAHFLVDCGMVQGGAGALARNDAEFDFAPGALDFVLLTHAHADHCGRIPLLYKRGFRGEVVCTEATCDLARIVLEDASKHTSSYQRADVARIKWRVLEVLPGGEPQPLCPGLKVRLYPSAHIAGAVSPVVEWTEPGGRGRRVVFSGDIGSNTRQNDYSALLRHRQTPAAMFEGSTVVMESTYGGRTVDARHRDHATRLKALSDEVRRTCLEKGGTLIIPCFAIARTQDVLFDLNHLFIACPDLQNVPVYLDAKMAHEANRAYARAMREVGRDGLPVWLSDGTITRLGLDPNQPADVELAGNLVAATLDRGHSIRRAAASHRSPIVRAWRRHWRHVGSEASHMSHGPKVIVTGGGMCGGGAVRRHLDAYLGDRANTLMLTGHCGRGTNGGHLLELMGHRQRRDGRSAPRFRLDTPGGRLTPWTIKADICKLSGYSGHTDQDGLLDWFGGVGQRGRNVLGEQVVLVHGEWESRHALKREIESKVPHRVIVDLPDPAETFYLR